MNGSSVRPADLNSSSSLHEAAKVALPPIAPVTGKLGIGVVTFNRLEQLKATVERIKLLTKSPYELVVADDGSSDGTREWALRAGLSLLPCQVSVDAGAAENRGIAWNKNRALYSLLHSGCESIVLLEDDALPRWAGWESLWTCAASRWGHVNAIRDWLKVYGYVYAGVGTPELPFHAGMCTGQCTATSRRALLEVGFLDSRFKGYGWEHVEWTRRFGLAGWYGGLHMLAIYGGLEIRDPDTWEDCVAVASGGPGRNKANEDLMVKLLEGVKSGSEPIYRAPWSSAEEAAAFLAEVEPIKASSRDATIGG